VTRSTTKSDRMWEFLGHKDWTTCIKAIADEAKFSERHLWRLHAANRVEANLTDMMSVGSVPERQLAPLITLEPDDQKAVWQEVHASGKVTAAKIAAVASNYKRKPDPAVKIDVTPAGPSSPVGEQTTTPTSLAESTEVTTCQQCEVYRQEIATLKAEYLRAWDRVAELETKVKRLQGPTLEEMEAVIATNGGNVTKAAQVFGMPRKTFAERLVRLRRK
jgi:hypothetical protein